MSETSNRFRRDFAAGDMVRDAGLTTPDDVIRYDDISYGPDEKYNLLDVYRPKNDDAPLPVIAIIHGGAWVYGDKGVYQYYAMSLAQRGFAVVNFTYRLAPENKFPAQIEDICEVFRWMAGNCEKYGLDIKNVFAVGDSAGAHLLGLFAALYSNPGYLRALKEKYPAADFTLPAKDGAYEVSLNAIALNCGKYDISKDSETDQDTKLVIPDLLTEGGSSGELKLTDVTGWVTGDFPTVFMMTCPGDFLMYQAEFMMDAMMKNCVPFVFRFYGDKDDPLHHVFHCNMRLESAKICNDEECEFFKKHVRK